MNNSLNLELLTKSVVVWAGILVIAMANGIVRELILVPALGQLSGFIISGLTLSALIVYSAYLALPWLGTRNRSALVVIGLSWLVLTLVFEFSFGLLQGKSLSTLLYSYRFKSGNIWPVVLLITVAAPLIAAKIRRW